MFKQVTNLMGVSAPFEYILGTNAEAYALGEALVLSAGRLTVCAADATPEFICQKTQAAEATAVTPIPVMRVTEYQEYETTFSADGASIVPGDKVTLANGLQATATKTGGVFLVSGKEGTGGVGKRVTGYFRR